MTKKQTANKRSLLFTEDINTSEHSIKFTGDWNPMLLRRITPKLVKELKRYKVNQRRKLMAEETKQPEKTI